MNEIELLTKYMYKQYTEGVFKIVVTALTTRATDYIDLEYCRLHINEILNFIEVHRRYERLRIESKNALEIEDDVFKLNGHKFETLNDVEKALKNKAFL